MCRLNLQASDFPTELTFNKSEHDICRVGTSWLVKEAWLIFKTIPSVEIEDCGA